MSLVRAISRPYSTHPGQHEIRAAITDGVTAAMVATALMFFSTEIINYFGAKNPQGTTSLVGYYHTQLLTTWANLLPVMFVGLLSSLLSLVAIIASSRAKRPEPRRRPVGRTVLALTLAFVLSASAGMLVGWSFRLGAPLEGITFFLPALVPAALRLTTKEAFTYPTTPTHFEMNIT